MTEIF